jgi:hypothetical protein
MVAQVKPTKKNSPAVRTPENRDNLPADSYAKRGVDQGLPASSIETGREYQNRMNPSVANISKGNYAAEKKDGVKQRGSGAATKGFTSRGPLA